MVWFVYILRSTVNDKLYTGISPDPHQRLKKHNAGQGAKATRPGRPWCIVYVEEVGPKGDALRREIAIKKLTREQKLDLIRRQVTQGVTSPGSAAP